MNTLKQKIQEIRKDKKINQSEIAEYLGISQAAYAKIESGKTKMSIQTLWKIADFFEVSLSDLLIGEIDFQNNKFSNDKEVTELRVKLSDLQKQIEQKDLLIDLLKSEKERVKNRILDYMDAVASYQINILVHHNKFKITKEQSTEILKYMVELINIHANRFVDYGIIPEDELTKKVNDIWKEFDQETKLTGP